MVLFGIVAVLFVVGGCSKQQAYHEQLMTPPSVPVDVEIARLSGEDL